MSNSEWYIIPNLEEFTNKTRAIVYNNFGSWQDDSNIEVLVEDVKKHEQEDFDKILSYQESLVIVKENVKKQKHNKTQKIRFILNDAIFAEIVQKLNDRMVSNIIMGLVKKGLVETAFDEESNDFVFWVKENDKKEELEKPETD